MSEEDKIRAVVQGQIMQCLNRFYAIETGMWGGPLDALIIRTVVVGKVEARLYDISALSAVLGLPLATTHRKIRELEEKGFLTREKHGRSIHLSPTERTCQELDKSFEEMISTLRRLYQNRRFEIGDAQK